MPVRPDHEERDSLDSLRRENETLRQENARLKEQAGPVLGLVRPFLEDAPMAYHSLDEDARVRFVSQGWLDLFGQRRGEVLGKPFERFVAPEDQGAFRRYFARLKAEGQFESLECLCLQKDGHAFSVSLEDMVERDRDGRYLCTHSRVRDVTAQKMAQAVLAQREQFYRTVFDSAAVPIAIARNLVVLYANTCMAKILGYDSPAELIGAFASDFIAPHCVQEFVTRAAQREQGLPVPSQFQVDVLHRSGRTITTLANVSLIQLPDGQAIVGFFQDITEQQSIAHSLRQSEARFRKLFDEVPAIAVQGYSQDRTVIYWNAASEVLYGYSAGEALGKKLEELIIPPPMRPLVVEAIRAWVEHDVPIAPGELELMRKDGSLVPVFSCHVMQKTTKGNCELYCLDMDLTERHMARREISLARDAAEAANKAKSEFLANMSHEIRTPMNGILGMLQLLLQGGLTGESLEFVELAYQSSRRLLSLLNDILDFSRIESGKLALVNAPLKLEALFESVQRVFDLNATRVGLKLTWSVDPSAAACVVGDEARLRQVLFNLVGNAVKFTPSGSVHMSAWARPAPPCEADREALRVYLCVSDTGLGIPEDKIGQVFERFTQTDSSYTRQYEGAGLGLAIVKRIVDLMGGHIVVDSEVDQGTTVCVHLPMPPAQPRAASPVFSGGFNPRETGPGLCVLVAEDDRISQMYMRQLLGRLGHRATLVSNGHEAVEAVRSQPFDCVFMDVQMPVLDGLAATKRIREADAASGRSPTRIIAMTAYALTGDREKFLAAGMDGYLAKPVQSEDIAAALDAVLEQKRAQSG